jgi:hypothetical protein
MELTAEKVLELLSGAQKNLKVLLASEGSIDRFEEAYSDLYKAFRHTDISKPDFSKGMPENEKEKLFELAKEIIGSAIDVYEMATKCYEQTHEKSLTLVRLNALAVLQHTYYFLAFLDFETPTKNIDQLEALVRRGTTSDVHDHYVRQAIELLSDELSMRRKPPLPTPPHTSGRQNVPQKGKGGQRFAAV